jgi:pimeloyl-ACP methyl ester carboxylesterase
MPAAHGEGSVIQSPEEWRRAGRTVTVDGHEVFVADVGEGNRTVMVLHGFPGSSWDWCDVAAALAGRARVVLFDFLGHGFSAKPDQKYSLFAQTDLAIAVAAAAGIERCVLVSHDMGDTVAAEMLKREVEGTLPFAVDEAFLTNGSIFMDLVQLSAGQLALLSLPDEALTASLPLDAFRPGLEETFSPQHRPDAATIDGMLSLIANRDGDRVLPRIIRYVEERRAYQDRWTAGLAEYPGPMTAAWGALDPIAVVAMPHRLKQLRPATEIVIWDDVGHWPSIETPGRLAELIAAHL